MVVPPADSLIVFWLGKTERKNPQRKVDDKMTGMIKQDATRRSSQENRKADDTLLLSFPKENFIYLFLPAVLILLFLTDIDGSRSRALQCWIEK